MMLLTLEYMGCLQSSQMVKKMEINLSEGEEMEEKCVMNSSSKWWWPRVEDICAGRPLVPVPATNRDQRLPARGPTAVAEYANPMVPVPATNRDQRSK